MSDSLLKYIQTSIKTVPDYPKPGIMFRDITSLMQDAKAFSGTLDLLAERYADAGYTKIVGTEARGFIFGAALAIKLGIGFVPVRKPGKLPRETFNETYDLEYGQDELQIHQDALDSTDKVLIVDDLLATGGTVEATTKLIRKVGATTDEAAFVISLPELGGEARLKAQGINVFTLVEFEGE